MSTADSPNPPTASNLGQVRQMFVIPEAYVIAVAVWAGSTPVTLLLATPSIAAIHGLTAALGVIALAAPTLAAALFLLLRRRRSARVPLIFLSVVSGALAGTEAEAQWLLFVYGHQVLLVAMLWLPRVDAVLSPTYRDEVMPATPLVGRSRRAAWACAFLFAMFVTAMAAMLGTLLVG